MIVAVGIEVVKLPRWDWGSSGSSAGPGLIHYLPSASSTYFTACGLGATGLVTSYLEPTKITCETCQLEFAARTLRHVD